MDIEPLTRLSPLVVTARTWLEIHVLTLGAGVQAGLIAAASMMSFIAHRAMRPRAEGYVIARPLLPALNRIARATVGLIGVAIFLVLILIAIQVLDEVYPTLGSDLLSTALSLATAWAIIRLSASLVSNRQRARIFAWAVWFIAALNIVGLLAPLMRALDSVGIPLGTNRLTLLAVINGGLLFAALLWGAFFIAGVIKQRLHAATTLTPRTQVLVSKVVIFTLVVLAGTITLSSIGVNLAALAVFAGALGVGIGIGLQHQVSNIISGLFLLLDKSIKPGDVIEVGDSFGWVSEMSARYVGVVTRDNKELLIPNDTFVMNQVVNWSHSDRSVRFDVVFGVSYDSDPHRIRELATAAARGASRVSVKPKPVCHLTAFGDSSLDFVLRFWILDPENGVTNVKGEILLALWDAFKENEINIPYPHRVIIDRRSADNCKEARETL